MHRGVWDDEKALSCIYRVVVPIHNIGTFSPDNIMNDIAVSHSRAEAVHITAILSACPQKL